MTRVMGVVICLAAVCLAGCSAVEKGNPQSALFPVQQDGKWGFIDQTGQIVIKPQFDGIFHVQTGKELIVGQFNRKARLPKGLAIVRVDDEYEFNCIDRTGKIVTNTDFAPALQQPFYEGLAMVRVRDSRGHNKFGFIDKTGKTVIEPQFDGAESFSEGLAVVRVGKKSGYIDKTGKIVIEPQFDGASSFSEGLAGIVVRDEESEEKWGFIDKTGKIVINPQFDMVYWFSEGLALVKAGDKHGYIDRTGKYVIKPQFEDADCFSEGLAWIKTGDKYGYIDRTGKIVIKPKFDRVWEFHDGLAMVEVGDKYGYIDRTGKYIWEPTK